jgi:hypothetical protein
VGECLGLLPPHALKSQRCALGLKFDARHVGLQPGESVRSLSRDADCHIGGVADCGVAFGELTLGLVGCPVALGLTLARRLCSVAVSVAARSA